MLRVQWLWRCLLALGCLGVGVGVPAQSEAFPIPIGESFRLDIDGEHRVFYHRINDFPLDNEGRTLGEPGWGNVQHRLRLSPSFHIDKVFAIHGQIDFLTYDSLYIIPSDVGDAYTSPLRVQADGFRPVDPRHLWVSWRSPVGLFRLGQMPSHWGLGILANNGQTPTGEFAAPRFGDIVERIFWALPLLKPFTSAPVGRRLFLAAAFDVVFRDENADLLQGDLAFQGVFSMFYRQKKNVFAGVYVAIRRQENRDGRRLDVQAFDVFVKLSGDFAKGRVALDFALEAVVLTGFTTLIRTELGQDGVNLEAFGAVSRLGVRLPHAGLRVGLEMGFASGDNDLNDATSRLFRFDPDYQPSLILFQRALGAISARGADRAGDLNRVGFAPTGTDQIPSYGQVGNVFYVQPVIAYRPFAPFVPALRGLELKVGLLYARAVADPQDPFASFRAGGVNTTSFGRRAADAQDIGWELNASLSYRYDIWKSVSITAAVLYGHLFPGAALSSEDGNTQVSVDMFQARLTTRF